MFMDVVSRLKIDVEATLIDLRRFNVENPKLFQRRYLVIFINVVATLRK